MLTLQLSSSDNRVHVSVLVTFRRCSVCGSMADSPNVSCCWPKVYFFHMIKRHKNKHKMKNESILFVLASCIRFEKEMKENIDSRIKCLIMQLLNYRHRRWLEKKKLSMDSVHM